MSSSTPRSTTPAQGIPGDESMAVEPPTETKNGGQVHFEDGDSGDFSNHPREDETVRLKAPVTQPQVPEIRAPAPDSAAVTNSRVAELINQRSQMRTPENKRHRNLNQDIQPSPGHLPPFNWNGFEQRYSQALRDADAREQELLDEFEQLVKYFNAWASASSTHDDERAVKRLQTRERYVEISEASLTQKKKHLNDVLRAFQGALTLLSSK